jgi:hypothetical protein
VEEEGEHTNAQQRVPPHHPHQSYNPNKLEYREVSIFMKRKLTHEHDVLTAIEGPYDSPSDVGAIIPPSLVSSKRTALTMDVVASQPTLDAFLGIQSKPVMRTSVNPLFPTPVVVCDSCHEEFTDEYELLACSRCSSNVCSSCSVRFDLVRCLDC